MKKPEQIRAIGSSGMAAEFVVAPDTVALELRIFEPGTVSPGVTGEAVAPRRLVPVSRAVALLIAVAPSVSGGTPLVKGVTSPRPVAALSPLVLVVKVVLRLLLPSVWPRVSTNCSRPTKLAVLLRV